MKRFSFWLKCLFISTCMTGGGGVFPLLAQTRPVSGIVQDEAGDPIIGATVAVTGNPSIWYCN
jgi:hypothetical protein